jgi:hypothetical protein
MARARGKGSWTRSTPTSAHLLRPKASSRRPPSTYGFNSDDKSSPDAGSCPYSHASPLAALIRRVPPGALRCHPIPLRDDPGRLGQSPESYVQVGERGVVHAAEGGSESELDDQLDRIRGGGDGRGRRHARSAGATSSWRGAAPSRYILEYLKDVDYEYTSAMPVLSGLQFLRRRKGAHQLGCTVASLVKFSARVPQVNIDYFINYLLLN